MLYILATPIGNLEDLSDRAKRTLREADLILAEDTRQTCKLFAYIQTQRTLASDRTQVSVMRDKKAVSFHEHSGSGKLEWIIDELEQDKNVVYLTDAGTPNLSDPGGKLVEASLEAGIKVSPIPGPSALTALISVAPFSCQKFVFKGYFPKKKGRQKMIAEVINLGIPVFFFESPHRIKKTIQFLSDNLTNHKILIGRELTKKFEEIVFCDLTDKETLEKMISKGEFVFALVKL